MTGTIATEPIARGSPAVWTLSADVALAASSSTKGSFSTHSTSHE